MHNDLNLTPLLRKKYSDWPRTIGRYYASELYYLLNGLTTPEEWLTPPSKPTPLLLAMWNGTLVHQYVQDLLPSECNEIKVEWKHTIEETGEEIIVVGKVDHLPNTVNQVWEFKTSKKELPEPPDSKKEHAHQAKLYCTMTERPEGVVFQPVQHNSGLYLKHIETVTRDDAWFQAQMKELEVFHKKVLALSQPQSL